MDNSADELLMSADSHIQMSKHASYQLRGGLNASLPESMAGQTDHNNKFGTIAPPDQVNQSFQQHGAGKLQYKSQNINRSLKQVFPNPGALTLSAEQIRDQKYQQPGN